MFDRGEAAVSREILHREGFYPEESSGLFVGISAFEDERFAPVQFAVDDAVDLAWVFSLELGLLDSSRCVLALTGEPRKEKSQKRLLALLAAGAQRHYPKLTEVYRLATRLSQRGGGRGLFVLATATHGLSEQGGDYLVAADSLRDRLVKTGVEVKDLFETASTAVARRRLVLLDACRERLSEGTHAVADPAMSQSFAAAIAAATGLTVLSASTLGGYAYDDREKQNGVFSGSLVEGLLGAAPADARGFITVATLAEFAQEQVRSWVRQHRREHLEKSRGIEQRFDEEAKNLPLAIDPRRSRALEEHQGRRSSALVLLKENIGETLDGRSFEDIKAFLAGPSLPSAAQAKLLSEIETIDGSERAQRSLLHLFGTLRPRFAENRRTVFVVRPPTPRKKRARRLDGLDEGPTVPREPEPGELFADPFGLRFRWISGGTYTLGSTESDPERISNENLREVTISGFWLADTPTTQAFWISQGLENPSRFQGDPECPVENVSWYDAVEFANLLSRKSGLEPCYEISRRAVGKDPSVKNMGEVGYRLPTEAEWEVAARSQMPGCDYQARHGDIGAIAWYSTNSGGRTHPVRGKAPNAWGLYDILGNVWEWTGEVVGSNRVVRGGSWGSLARSL